MKKEFWKWLQLGNFNIHKSNTDTPMVTVINKQEIKVLVQHISSCKMRQQLTEQTTSYKLHYKTAMVYN